MVAPPRIRGSLLDLAAEVRVVIYEALFCGCIFQGPSTDSTSLWKLQKWQRIINQVLPPDEFEDFSCGSELPAIHCSCSTIRNGA